mmetsp:Transcript_17837/g.44990  ORF Transcript_17837/g.44990 Transcript_17837/m.44990 type:complete len:284 (-) Transcript_17837:1915-2766(-)
MKLHSTCRMTVFTIVLCICGLTLFSRVRKESVSAISPPVQWASLASLRAAKGGGNRDERSGMGEETGPSQKYDAGAPLNKVPTSGSAIREYQGACYTSVADIQGKKSERWHAGMSDTRAPWNRVMASRGRMRPPMLGTYWDNGPSSEMCNPAQGSCDCFDWWANRSFCREVAHRQKPLLEISFADMPLRHKMFDCPTVRCRIVHSAHYSATTQALVISSLTSRFPPKMNAKTNKNVLVSMEPALRFKQLGDPEWMLAQGVDLFATHRLVWEGLIFSPLFTAFV